MLDRLKKEKNHTEWEAKEQIRAFESKQNILVSEREKAQKAKLSKEKTSTALN